MSLFFFDIFFPVAVFLYFSFALLYNFLSPYLSYIPPTHLPRSLLFYCSFSFLSSSHSLLCCFPSSPSHFTSKFSFLNILYLLSPLHSFIYSSCFFFYVASFNFFSSFLLLSFLCSLFYNVLPGATVTKFCAKDNLHK
jgi:hypothetical protein